MIPGKLLGAGRVAEVFEHGADVIKLYLPGVGPEQARHEAMVLDALVSTSLLVPSNMGVSQVGERWGLCMSRMPGIALGTQLGRGDISGMLETLVGQHRCVLACTVAGLPRLKPRLAERIEHASDLPETTRVRLLERLWDLPDGAQLCHGDFHPFNIMVDGDRLGVIDWLDATVGPPEADIARTYLLLALHLPEMAERYLAAMTDDLTMDRRRVMDWLPVVASARLVEGVAGETERLLAWCRLA